MEKVSTLSDEHRIVSNLMKSAAVGEILFVVNNS